MLTATTNLGSTEIKRGHTVQTGLNGGTSIRRYYDISPTNDKGLNASLIFKFDDSELNGKPEPTLKLFRSSNSGGSWSYQGGTVNIATNEITLDNIASFSRWSADSSGLPSAITLIMQGFYNIPTNNLNMSDTVRIYLRNLSSPHSIVDSSKGIIDSLTFRYPFQFSNASTGTYYLQIKHRNSLETWSKIGVIYTMGNTINYDFTFAANQAYGNNMILKGTRYCIYSGDVNQDGSINVLDLGLVDNDAGNFVTGYVNTDVNGDRAVNALDLGITDNNAFNFVSKVTPP